MHLTKRTYSSHKLRRRLACGVAVAMGLLATSATSVLAAPTDPADGLFTAVTNLNPPTSGPCATYRLYNVGVAFRNAAAPNAPTGESFTAHSDPNPLSQYFQWGEFGDGTHHPQTSALGTTSCNDAAGQYETGFTGTAVLNGSPTPRVCNLASSKPVGTQPTTAGYKRTDISLEYKFDIVTGVGCPSPFTVNSELLVLAHFDPPLVIPPGIEITDLAACNSLIAPSSCVLTKSTHS